MDKHKNEIKKPILNAMATPKKQKSQVAQCCAKTSAIVAGCHD